MSETLEARKTYLGDGVYAMFDGWHIWLYTSDGIRESDKIAIEPQVFAALRAYTEDVWRQKL